MRRFRVPHPDGAYQWRLQLNLSAAPTGNPEFQLLEVGRTTDDLTLAGWTDGAWAVAYDSTTKTAWATTPIIGAGGLTVDAGRSYTLLCRPDLGGGLTPILEVAELVVAGSIGQPPIS